MVRSRNNSSVVTCDAIIGALINKGMIEVRGHLRGIGLTIAMETEHGGGGFLRDKVGLDKILRM